MKKVIKNKEHNLQIEISDKGVFIALFIILLWFVNLYLAFSFPLSIFSIVVFVLLQSHLYTGVFISAHDAMHSTISTNQKINDAIGKTCSFMFAFFNYNKLLKNHHKHHDHVGEHEDPDYYEGSFFVWYFQFLKHYIGIWQLIFYAISFNLLALFLPKSYLIIFWILPAILSTFQLFYFGTYLPHKKEHHHKNKHKSDSYKQNHFLAFITCYFFGYHYEHHEIPYAPWWQLWKVKEAQIENEF